MICPILSNANQDEQGNVTWNHHECIEGSCSFWAEEITDCGLRASGLVIIGRAKAAMNAQREGGDESGAPIGEPLFAPPKLTMDPKALEPVLEAIREAAPDPRTFEAIHAAIREAAPDPKAFEAIRTAIREAASDPRAFEEIRTAIREAAPDPKTFEAIHAAIREAAPDPRAFDAILEAVERINASGRDTGLKLLEGVAALEEPLKATGRELGGRIEALNEAVLSVTTSVEGRMARVDEAIAGLQRSFEQARDARPSWLQEIDRSLEALGKRLGTVTDRFGPLSKSIETLAAHLTALREAHEEISGSLAQEADRRREDEKRRHAEDAMALNSRGVSLYYSGALDAAEAAFRSALELKPDFAEASNNLGLALSRQGRDAEAEACFGKALELEPAMSAAMNNLGFLFHRGMKFEKAVEMFSRSALTGEDSSIAWTNMGNACYKMGKFSDAVDAWKKAVAADPTNEGAREALRMFQQEQAGQA